MRNRIAFIAMILIVAGAIVASILLPVTSPEPQMISLPVSRMLSCPIGDATLGTTTVTVTDQENFVSGELNALGSDPTTNASIENPSKPVIVRGSATVGAVSVYSEPDHEMAAPCAPPITAGSWNGVSIQDGATLVFTNVDTASAVVDVFLYGQTGPIAQPGLRDIPVASGVTQMLPISSGLTRVDTPISVQIRASKGRVAAILRTIGEQGYDWQLPQTSPDTDLLIVGIPAGEGNRSLNITNTDPVNKAVIAVEIMGESGSFAPLGLETIEMAPSRATSVDITGSLGGQASAVRLISDRPVTATVVISGADIAGISAQSALNGAVVLPGMGGVLWVANPSDETATLTLDSTGSGLASSHDFDVTAHTILSIPFPSSGTVKLSTQSSVIRTSLVLSTPSLSVLPISGGGIVASIPVPQVAPGLG